MIPVSREFLDEAGGQISEWLVEVAERALFPWQFSDGWKGWPVRFVIWPAWERADAWMVEAIDRVGLAWHALRHGEWR